MKKQQQHCNALNISKVDDTIDTFATPFWSKTRAITCNIVDLCLFKCTASLLKAQHFKYSLNYLIKITMFQIFSVNVKIMTWKLKIFRWKMVANIIFIKYEIILNFVMTVKWNHNTLIQIYTCWKKVHNNNDDDKDEINFRSHFYSRWKDRRVYYIYFTFVMNIMNGAIYT